MKYRIDGIERKLALGRYPDVLLGEARRKRDYARDILRAGIDPAADKRRQKIARKLAAGTSFEDVAEEYIAKVARDGKSAATIDKLKWARGWLKPTVGHRPIDQIEPHELLLLLRRLEASGNLETARRGTSANGVQQGRDDRTWLPVDCKHPSE